MAPSATMDTWDAGTTTQKTPKTYEMHAPSPRLVYLNTRWPIKEIQRTTWINTCVKTLHSQIKKHGMQRINFQFSIDIVFINTLLCEPALLVKGKSFVTLYTDFSFKQLKENALVKEFSLLLKGKSFRD